MLPANTFYQQYLTHCFGCDGFSSFVDTAALTELNVGAKRFESPQAQAYCEALLETRDIGERVSMLKPWRKGPFQFGDVFLDAEWRCDLKWKRVLNRIDTLTDKTILDIGCGNGYYLFQAAEHAPSLIIGIDPSALYFFQFQMIRHYYAKVPVYFLPIGWQDLSVFLKPFDVVMCMGVLYHYPDPLGLLRECRLCVSPGGQLILETLVIDNEGDAGLSIYPNRYACMPNVYELPSVKRLERWVLDAGFSTCEVGDVVATTSDEQRVTSWGPQKSLKDFLDVSGQKTIEGFPAPKRVIVVAS